MSKKGFTLIELLIVIVIIGILSVAVVPRVLDYPKKARDATRKNHIAALNTAMMSLVSEKNPDYTAVTSGCLTSTTFPDLITYFGAGELPKDPSASQKYGSNSCNGSYWFVVSKDTNNKITGFAFIAPMEVVSNGNFNTDPTVSTVLIDLVTAGSGKYYFVKQAL